MLQQRLSCNFTPFSPEIPLCSAMELPFSCVFAGGRAEQELGISHLREGGTKSPMSFLHTSILSGLSCTLNVY